MIFEANQHHIMSDFIDPEERGYKGLREPVSIPVDGLLLVRDYTFQRFGRRDVTIPAGYRVSLVERGNPACESTLKASPEKTE